MGERHENLGKRPAEASEIPPRLPKRATSWTTSLILRTSLGRFCLNPRATLLRTSFHQVAYIDWPNWSSKTDLTRPAAVTYLTSVRTSACGSPGPCNQRPAPLSQRRVACHGGKRRPVEHIRPYVHATMNNSTAPNGQMPQTHGLAVDTERKPGSSALRIPTVHEALPYTPFSSIVPFNAGQ